MFFLPSAVISAGGAFALFISAGALLGGAGFLEAANRAAMSSADAVSSRFSLATGAAAVGAGGATGCALGGVPCLLFFAEAKRAAISSADAASSRFSGAGAGVVETSWTGVDSTGGGTTACCALGVF